jgi:Na+/H+ antiporter NhaD/arsenite permease-like protein
MMIVIGYLRLSGFFGVISRWAFRHAHRPLVLLGAIAAGSGDNVNAGRNPVPYLLAVAMASNAGSAATITGNPQNMMIASFSGIANREFAAALAPIALTGVS